MYKCVSSAYFIQVAEIDVHDFRFYFVAAQKMQKLVSTFQAQKKKITQSLKFIPDSLSKYFFFKW